MTEPDPKVVLDKAREWAEKQQDLANAKERARRLKSELNSAECAVSNAATAEQKAWDALMAVRGEERK